MSIIGQLVLVFSSVAMFSVGGASSLLPEFHRQIVDLRGWMTGADFAHLVALSQIAPGPNMLIVSLIGWRIAGAPGLLASTGAIIVPPALLAFAAGRALGRLKGADWLASAKWGLAPVVVGLMFASGVITAEAANYSMLGWVITAFAAWFKYVSRANPLLVVGVGASAGVAAGRLGLI